MSFSFHCLMNPLSFLQQSKTVCESNILRDQGISFLNGGSESINALLKFYFLPLDLSGIIVKNFPFAVHLVVVQFDVNASFHELMSLDVKYVHCFISLMQFLLICDVMSQHVKCLHDVMSQHVKYLHDVMSQHVKCLHDVMSQHVKCLHDVMFCDVVTYGRKSSCALLMACLPIIITPSCMASSIKHPPF